MFLDCTKRPIGDSGEFAVAINNVICHGLAMEPENYDLTCEEDEELLVIECFNSFAKKKTDRLSEQIFRSKKDEVVILPNVFIIDDNVEPYVSCLKPSSKEEYLKICQSMPNQLRVKALRCMTVEQINQDLGDNAQAKALYQELKKSREGYMRIQRELPTPDGPHDGWTYAFCKGIALFIDNLECYYHTSVVQEINWETETSGTFTTLNSRYRFEFIEPEIG